jgi:tetratricopeptide (TPR) repeat protein
VLSALLLAGCDSGERGFLRELLRIEGASTYGGEEPSQERIEELKQEIEEYRSIVEEKVEAAGQLGTYHKMLGLAYMDERMFGLALDHLEQAISIQPENAILLYHAGVCSAQTAKSTVDEQERRRLLRDAEQYYLRSIELDPERNDANYALGVLYTFELDEPAEARPYLQQMIEDEPKNERAYMVLARSFAATGNVDRAVELYDQAAEVTSNDEVRQAALRNREALLEGQAQ